MSDEAHEGRVPGKEKGGMNNVKRGSIVTKKRGNGKKLKRDWGECKKMITSKHRKGKKQMMTEQGQRKGP